MYTLCPECSTAFRVTAEVLKQAAGKVRCGGCGNAFNALDYLSEQKPAPKQADTSFPTTAADNDDAVESTGIRPAPGGHDAPASISTEQSAALLKTLDELAGQDIRLEDTGVEWRVVADTQAENSPLDQPRANTDTGSMRFILSDDDTDVTNLDALLDDTGEIRVDELIEDTGASSLDETLDDTGETNLDEVLEQAPTPVDEVLSDSPNRIDSPEIFEPEVASTPANADEMRFDDNTPLPDDFGAEIDDEPADPAPVLETREPHPEHEDRQVDLALGEPEDWEQLLDEFDELEAVTGAAEAVSGTEAAAADDAAEPDIAPTEEPQDAEPAEAATAAFEFDGTEPEEAPTAAYELDEEPEPEHTRTAVYDLDGEPGPHEESTAAYDLDEPAEAGDEPEFEVGLDDESGPDEEPGGLYELDDDTGPDAESTAATARDDHPDDAPERPDSELVADSGEADSEDEPREPLEPDPERGPVNLDDLEIPDWKVGAEFGESVADIEIPPETEEEQTINRLIDQDLLALAMDNRESSSTIAGDPDSSGENRLVETIIMEGESIRDALEEERLVTEAAAGEEPEKPRFTLPPEEEEPQKFRLEPLHIAGGAAVLVLLLGLQALHQWRETLATIPALNGPITSIYGALGKPVTPQWDVTGWRFEATRNSTDEDDSALTINTRLGNQSQSALPYPVISVALTDRFEETIGNRVFEPADYLAAAPADTAFVDPGATFEAELVVDLPSADADGFKLNVCYSLDGGRLRCAIEDFR